MNVRVAFLCLMWPFAAMAQGFAGLATDAQGFAMPERGAALEFPRDHGAHPDFRIEWWYVTATLTGTDGRDYGAQWTLFRSALAPYDTQDWSSPQVWLGHAAITTETDHYAAERYGRGGIGQAGASDERLEAWIDDWTLSETGMSMTSGDWGYDLVFDQIGPTVLQGDAGYSVKSASGQASHYYSHPFIPVSGSLHLPKGDVEVTGQAWLDREWSSQPLAADQTGWDWFSLVFDSGARLMGFRLRGAQDFTAATWIDPDGTPTPFANGEFVAEPLEIAATDGGPIPVRWHVRLPRKQVDVTVIAMNSNAWMSVSIPYWEGPVYVTGTHQGRGYLEMTGYAEPDDEE